MHSFWQITGMSIFVVLVFAVGAMFSAVFVGRAMPRLHWVWRRAVSTPVLGLLVVLSVSTAVSAVAFFALESFAGFEYHPCCSPTPGYLYHVPVLGGSVAGIICILGGAAIMRCFARGTPLRGVSLAVLVGAGGFIALVLWVRTLFTERYGPPPVSTTMFAFAMYALPGVVFLSVFSALSKPQEAEPGCCICGYDLTGNTSGVCPECGQEVMSGKG